MIVLYRGSEKLEARAQVTLKKEPIGYIDEVLPCDGMTRVVVKLKSASLVHDGDHFVPCKDEASKLGFNVRHIEGEPLKAGMEIEADPDLARRQGPPPSELALGTTDAAPDRAPRAEGREFNRPDGMKNSNRFENRAERLQKVSEQMEGKRDAVLLKRFQDLAASTTPRPTWRRSSKMP